MCASVSARAVRAWRRVSRAPAPTAGFTTSCAQVWRARNSSSAAAGSAPASVKLLATTGRPQRASSSR